MNKSEYIFIVRVHMRNLEHDLKRKDGIYKDIGVKTASNLEALHGRAQALEFEGAIMAFVIRHVKETPTQYSIMFEGQAFTLDKKNLGNRWYRFNDCFEFRLCKTAREAWDALRGYYYQLHEQVLKARRSQPKGEWEPL